METRPTVHVYTDKTKKRKSDGLVPLNIVVTYRRKRVKESTGIYVTEKEFRKGAYRTNRALSKRLREIDQRIDDLLSDGGFDPLSKVLRSPVMTPAKIISEMVRVKRLSVRTHSGYLTALHSLQDYFGEDFTLSSLTLPSIQGYARAVRVSPPTMAFYLKDLKALLGYAKERGYVRENVMERWRFRGEGFRDREKPRSRSVEEIKGYVKLWRTSGDRRVRESLGIWLSGFTFCGMAIVDLMAVDWSGVEGRLIGDGYYYSFTINRRKTKETAFITVPVTDLSRDLLSFLKTVPWAGRSHYPSYVNACLKLTDRTLTYYQCRHSFASLLVASRTPLNTIASMLGRSVNGLSTYIHRVTEPSVLSEASKALLVFEEGPEVTKEEEVSVFEELVKK